MEIREATIESLDFFGNGITHIDGKVCFIKNTLPGEKVNFSIEENRKNYSKGVLHGLIKNSPHRIQPKCIYFEKCGGCDFQHIPYEYELNIKKNHIKESLKRIGNINIDNDFDIIESPIEYYYRNNVTFHIENGLAGFYEKKSHKNIIISSCCITNERINKAISIINSLRLDKVKEINIRIDNNENLIVIIRGNCKQDFNKIIKETIIDGIILIDNKKETVFGLNKLTYNVGNVKLNLPYDSFFQINTDAAEQMMIQIKKILSGIFYHNIIDLYCGVGTVGQSIANNNDKIYGIEIVKNAVKYANKNAVKNCLNGYYVSGRTENLIKGFLKGKRKDDLIIIDPPRQGLQGETVNILKEHNSKYILYISCNPGTLSRDLNVLKDRYNLVYLRAFDLFPRTANVETVVLLENKH